MALALNNLKRVDMPLNKETKPYAKGTSQNKVGSSPNFSKDPTFLVPQVTSINRVIRK